MTSRRIYTLLLRLHPRRFRERFGEELLTTFDDAVEDRGSFALLFDALASLLRQWTLRPANWGRSKPEVGMSGGLPSALLLEADRSYRRVLHLNYLWFTACFLIWFMLPSRPNEGFLESPITFLMFLLIWSGAGFIDLHAPLRVSWLRKHRPRSPGNIARNALKTKVDRLRTFNPFFAVVLMFWRLTRPQPMTRFLISLGLFLAVSVLGFFVRRANRQIADRIAGQIPAE
jgi:hypothetical protein